MKTRNFKDFPPPSMPLIYVYFVSYIYLNNGDVGYGRKEIGINKEIEDIEDIREMESMLLSGHTWSRCDILNYNLLREEQ